MVRANAALVPQRRHRGRDLLHADRPQGSFTSLDTFSELSHGRQRVAEGALVPLPDLCPRLSPPLHRRSRVDHDFAAHDLGSKLVLPMIVSLLQVLVRPHGAPRGSIAGPFADLGADPGLVASFLVHVTTCRLRVHTHQRAFAQIRHHLQAVNPQLLVKLLRRTPRDLKLLEVCDLERLLRKELLQRARVLAATFPPPPHADVFRDSSSQPGPHPAASGARFGNQSIGPVRKPLHSEPRLLPAAEVTKTNGLTLLNQFVAEVALSNSRPRRVAGAHCLGSLGPFVIGHVRHAAAAPATFVDLPTDPSRRRRAVGDHPPKVSPARV